MPSPAAFRLEARGAVAGYFRPSSCQSGVRVRKEEEGSRGPGVKVLRPQANPVIERDGGEG